MTKYIDAELLRKEIERLKDEYTDIAIDSQRGWVNANSVIDDLEQLQSQIDSLQQEQQEKSKKDCNDCPHCVDRKDQYGWHFRGCFGGPYKGKFIAEIDECPLKQEQPEVDLEKEYQEFCNDHPFPWSSQYVNREYIDELCLSVARHFYNLGCRRTAEKADEIEYNRQRSEEDTPNDLEEAARKSAIAPFNLDIDEEHLDEYPYLPIAEQKFIEGAKWQKEQMMKEAVEGYVNYYEDSGGILMAEAQVGCPYHNGDKVRIIIIKEEKNGTE